MSKIMNILKEYIKRLFGRPTPQLMLTELRKKGAYIGEDVNIHGYVNIDKGFPFMLHIGNHVEITDKVTILTHDYSWSVGLMDMSLVEFHLLILVTMFSLVMELLS